MNKGSYQNMEVGVQWSPGPVKVGGAVKPGVGQGLASANQHSYFRN